MIYLIPNEGTSCLLDLAHCAGFFYNQNVYFLSKRDISL